jgi:hypothetical protein
MARLKPTSKTKGRRSAVTALGVAGALSLAGSASASVVVRHADAKDRTGSSR